MDNPGDQRGFTWTDVEGLQYLQFKVENHARAILALSNIDNQKLPRYFNPASFPPAMNMPARIAQATTLLQADPGFLSYQAEVVAGTFKGSRYFGGL